MTRADWLIVAGLAVAAVALFGWMLWLTKPQAPRRGGMLDDFSALGRRR